MDLTSWVVPCVANFLKIEKFCSQYINSRYDHRQWLGTMESLIALAYLRFRPGAKLNISSFKISNDHSHRISIREFQMDLQGVKRSVFGGSSMDLLNLKTPVYHSYQILELLELSERVILIELALESVNFMLEDTYYHDLNAQEYLRGLQLLLNKLLKVYGIPIQNQNIRMVICRID